jgi:hypothetical protein
MRHLVKGLRDTGRKVTVTASTGIAATLLTEKGLLAQTIHRFSGIMDGR